MEYRWKHTLEAIQLPGDLPDIRPDLGRWAKGNWLVFEDGQFSRCCSNEEFQRQVEPLPRSRKKIPQAAENPKRGRPRGTAVPRIETGGISASSGAPSVLLQKDPAGGGKSEARTPRGAAVPRIETDGADTGSVDVPGNRSREIASDLERAALA